MVPVTSLNRHVSFQKLLPLLGVRVRSNALPTVVSCPLCRGESRLHVYQDATYGGEWAFCRNCRFTGNMIRLAGETWKLEAPAALARLGGMQVGLSPETLTHEAITAYTRDHVKRLRQIQEFWDACRKGHLTLREKDLAGLQNRFNCLPNDGQWPEKMGRFVGSTTTEILKELVRPGDVGTRKVEVFPGGRWKSLLAIPFYDLPGRICGFAFIGREGDRTAGDWRYRTLSGQACVEAGLGFLDAILQPHPDFDAAFVFTTPEPALQLHTRHFAGGSTRPLPIAISWADDKRETANVWNWLGGENLVFWSRDDRLEAIAQAKVAGGRVSMLQLTPSDFATNLRKRSGLAWLHMIREQAVSWQTALRTYLDAIPLPEAEAILQGQLRFTASEISDFIAGCPQDMQTRLLAMQRSGRYGTRVRFQSQWFYVRDDSWYREKGDELIASCVIRIEQVVTATNRKSYYRGVIRYKGQEYPFVDRVDNMEKGLLSWARSRLRDVERAGVIEFLPGWDKKSLQLTLAYCQPRMTSGVDAIGWDDQNRQFNFPQFAIQRDGTISDEFSCLFAKDNVPCGDVPVPEGLPLRCRQSLSETNEETSIVWGLIACVAASVVAPAVNREPVGTLLVGVGARCLGAEAARLIGCPEGPPYRTQDAPSYARRLIGQHRFPALFADAPIGNWLDSREGANLIVAPSDVAARVLGVRGQWNLLCHDRDLGSLQLTRQAIPYVLPHYLQDLYSRGLLLGESREDFVLDVLADVADWFDRIGGDRAAVEAATQLLELPGTSPPWKHFLHLAFALHETGALFCGRSDFERAPIMETTHGDEPAMQVSQELFSSAVRSSGSVPPDLLLITKSLSDEGVLLDEPTDRRDRGWIVPRDWWNHHLEAWRKRC